MRRSGAESIINLLEGSHTVLANRDAPLSGFGGIMGLDPSEKEKA